MTKRMATVELYPGLFQRANFLSWTYKQKQELLKEHGITMVVNLWNKVDPDLSGQVLYVCWPIRGNALPDGAKGLILLTAAMLKKGERVLVHCEAGVNRSVWFCAEVIAQLNGWTLKQAHEHIANILPRANPHKAFRGEEDE